MSAQQPSAAPHAAPSAALTAIPFRRDDDAGAAALAGGGAGILLISLLAIGAVLYLRRRFNLHGAGGGIGPARLVRVLESTRLGPRTLLSVVEFDGTRYLVAQGEHGVSCLAEKPASVREAA